MATEKDKISFDISLENNNELLTIFCLCRKKDIKHMNKTYGELKNICKSYNLEFINENITLLAEDKDIFLSIFDINKDNKSVIT